MYKVYASDTHFVMHEKRMSTGATGMSLVARYNKELPGLEEVFLEALKLFQCQEFKGLKKDEYKNLRLKVITNAIESFVAYDYNLDYLKSQGYDFIDYTERALHRHWLNKHNRIKRFQRKADLNCFNYFVSITYDSKKHTEESFESSLRRCLGNLHTRRGWLCMGSFERSPEEQRLHFHCFIHVPEGEMVGALIEDESYNKKRHRREKRILNTFFGEQFGRTDFVDITDANVYKSTLKNYITKYIYKSDEDKKMFYSRGISTYIETDLPLEEYIFCVANEFAKSYYLGDNSFYCDEETNRFLMYDRNLIQTHNRIHLRV